jgi:hypothetical protein
MYSGESVELTGPQSEQKPLTSVPTPPILSVIVEHPPIHLRRDVSVVHVPILTTAGPHDRRPAVTVQTAIAIPPKRAILSWKPLRVPQNGHDIGPQAVIDRPPLKWTEKFYHGIARYDLEYVIPVTHHFRQRFQNVECTCQF